MNNKTLAKFEYGRFYHVFNRTNNKEILFHSDENKRYFLQLVKERLQGYVKLYAFALLDNHFHFAISICEETNIECHIKNLPSHCRRKTELEFLESHPDERKIHTLISRQWSRIFNSYTQAINKRFNREGHLFHTPFKRSVFNSKTKFGLLIYYIHHNSRKHGLVVNFKSDLWHSYHIIIENDSSFLESDFTLEWFGGNDAFIEFHKAKHLVKDFSEISIE